jgi:hypothetical protein
MKLFDRRSEGEKRYDALAAEADATHEHLLTKDLVQLTDEEKKALATAGIFGGSLSLKCFAKSIKVANDRADSTKLKDRFRRAIDPGYMIPRAYDRKIVREVKEELVRDYDAYQARLEYLRKHGATAERIAQEAQKLAEELKTAGTLATDLKVGKPLSLKKAKPS